MTNHAAVAISSSIIILAAALLVGLGVHAGHQGGLLAGAGALLGLLALISWVASVKAMQRDPGG